MLWNYMQLKINLNKFHVNVFLVVIMHILYLLNASIIQPDFVLIRKMISKFEENCLYYTYK